MTDHVLTLNAGSSSVKFALFARSGNLDRPWLSGVAEGLGATARLRVKDAEGAVRHDAALPGAGGAAPTHADALAAILEVLEASASDVRVAVVGHRIVHGGATHDHPVVVDDVVLAGLAALEPLAPLHQPHNLAGVRAAREAFPGVPQVACFDTAFHRAQPDLNQRYALPARLHEAGIRRYGFHGLSYESIAAQLVAGRGDDAGGRAVVAHLGNGASLCAMREGRSVATTMGFSPLDGMPMGTRCGHIDPAAVLHLVDRLGLPPAEAARVLYRESGLAGLSGMSGDMRELEAADTPEARRALDYFVEHAAREIAAMAAALDGLDVLVFTGGIGENAAAVRARIVGRLGWLGLALDADANARGRGTISAAGSRAEVLVLHTNEEGVIARHAARAAGLAA